MPPMDDWNWDVAANAVDTDDYAAGDGDSNVEVVPLKGLAGARRKKRLPFEPTGKSHYIASKDPGPRKGVIPLSVKDCEAWFAQYEADPEAASDFPLVSADVNGTLGVFTYGQSRLSCRGSASRWCRDNCYAGSIVDVDDGSGEREGVLVGAGQFVYDTTIIPAHFRWCLSRKPQFATLMVEHLRRRPEVKVLRVFSEGDFSSPANVEAWRSVSLYFSKPTPAIRRKRVIEVPPRQFTFYTRKWVLGGAWVQGILALAKLPNVTIELSWDPSMPFPPMSLLKHTGLSVSGVSPAADNWLERLSALALAAGGQLIFCPKNLSTVCADEDYTGISCAECKWCYGGEKRPMVYYLLHGLHFRKRDEDDPMYKDLPRPQVLVGTKGKMQKATVVEAIERADWSLAQTMLRAGMVPPKYKAGACQVRTFEEGKAAHAAITTKAKEILARKGITSSTVSVQEWRKNLKNTEASVYRAMSAAALERRRARGMLDE